MRQTGSNFKYMFTGFFCLCLLYQFPLSISDVRLFHIVNSPLNLLVNLINKEIISTDQVLTYTDGNYQIIDYNAQTKLFHYLYKLLTFIKLLFVQAPCCNKMLDYLKNLVVR